MNVYLWELYKEVEYIQSSWTQYIDTWYTLSSNSSIETKLSIVSWVWNYDMQYGSYGTSWDKPSMFMQRNYPDNNKLRVITYSNGYSDRKYIDSINNLVFNTDYNIVHTNTSFIINWVSQGTMSATTYTCDKTAYIFWVHTKRWIGWPSAMKLYSFKIYESWTLVRDFVPCYRVSDNVIWLFDKVWNKFYTNAGTGSFTKWNDVKVFQPELKNAYIGEVFEYSYDFRNKSNTTLTNDGWNIFYNSSYATYNSYWITTNTAGQSVTAKKEVLSSIMPNAKKVTLSFTWTIVWYDWFRLSLYKTATSSTRDGVSWPFFNSDTTQTTIYWTHTTDYVTNSWLITITTVLDFTNKTWKTTNTNWYSKTWTLTDTQISNIKNNSIGFYIFTSVNNNISNRWWLQSISVTVE